MRMTQCSQACRRAVTRRRGRCLAGAVCWCFLCSLLFFVLIFGTWGGSLVIAVPALEGRDRDLGNLSSRCGADRASAC